MCSNWENPIQRQQGQNELGHRETEWTEKMRGLDVSSFNHSVFIVSSISISSQPYHYITLRNELLQLIVLDKDEEIGKTMKTERQWRQRDLRQLNGRHRDLRQLNEGRIIVASQSFCLRCLCLPLSCLKSLCLCLHCLFNLCLSVFIVSQFILSCLILSLYNIAEWTSSINSIRQDRMNWETMKTERQWRQRDNEDRDNEDRDNEDRMIEKMLNLSQLSLCLFNHSVFIVFNLCCLVILLIEEVRSEILCNDEIEKR